MCGSKTVATFNNGKWTVGNRSIKTEDHHIFNALNN